MSRLAFLKTVSVIAVAEPAKRAGGGGARKEWNPTEGLVLRLWKSGAVYPSQEMVDKFDLEYRNCLTEEQEEAIKADTLEKPAMGFGFDVADTQDFPAFKVDGRYLIISSVPKDVKGGRVDLFGTVTYNEEDNTPKLKVFDQGNTTFGKDFLIPRIEEIYGITFAKAAVAAVEAKPAETDAEGKVIKSAVEARAAVPAVEGVEYLDLILLGQEGENSDPFSLPVGKIAYFPKIVSRGDAKGESTVARRENPQMYILYPKIWLDEEKAQAAGEDPRQETVPAGL
jgi:hypothetical protein